MKAPTIPAILAIGILYQGLALYACYLIVYGEPLADTNRVLWLICAQVFFQFTSIGCITWAFIRFKKQFS